MNRISDSRIHYFKPVVTFCPSEKFIPFEHMLKKEKGGVSNPGQNQEHSFILFGKCNEGICSTDYIPWSCKNSNQDLPRQD